MQAADWKNDELVVGTVIRSYEHNTTPPKVKFWIIVGVSSDGVALAAVYINTRPNAFILRNPVLANAQFPVVADSRRLVDYNCYANCSTLKIKDAAATALLLKQHPHYVRGELYPEEIDHLMKLLRECPNIAPRDKQRFGIQ